MPNACPARRDVCISSAPKDEKRSPYLTVRPGCKQNVGYICAPLCPATNVELQHRHEYRWLPEISVMVITSESSVRPHTPLSVRSFLCKSSSLWSFWDSYTSSTRPLDADILNRCCWQNSRGGWCQEAKLLHSVYSGYYVRNFSFLLNPNYCQCCILINSPRQNSCRTHRNILWMNFLEIIFLATLHNQFILKLEPALRWRSLDSIP